MAIQNAGLLGARYRDMLKPHGVAHVYTHWSYMPPLAEQRERLSRSGAPFTVLRLLTPLKMICKAAKQRAQTYDKIGGELPEMQRDTATPIRRATTDGRSGYVLVSNRAEGNAPLTVQALVDRLRQQSSA